MIKDTFKRLQRKIFLIQKKSVSLFFCRNIKKYTFAEF